jgi:hypothetical protein
MRINVNFYGGPTFGNYFGFVGPGTLHLNETALQLEGDFPRFPVPLGINPLRQLVCDPSIRTVPYSRIVSHKPPSFLRRGHLLEIRLPSGKKQKIGFKLLGKDKRHEIDRQLTAGIEQNREVARSLLGI